MFIDFLNHLQGSFLSLMEEETHDFCETLVLLKGTDTFLLFLRG